MPAMGDFSQSEKAHIVVLFTEILSVISPCTYDPTHYALMDAMFGGTLGNPTVQDGIDYMEKWMAQTA